MIRAPLHVLVVILISVYRACSCSLLTPPPPLLLYFLYSLFIIYSVSFPLFFQFIVTGAGAGFFWRAGHVAGLQVGGALRCCGCLGLGSGVPVPHVPGHPISICHKGINYSLHVLHYNCRANYEQTYYFSNTK